MTEALRLPTFQADGLALHRRLTLTAEGGTVVKVLYPVFPPDRPAAEVVRVAGESIVVRAECCSLIRES